MRICDFVRINSGWLADVENHTTLQKGKDYFLRHRVKLTRCEKEDGILTLSAHVKSANSNDEYDVFIEFAEDGDVIDYDCECPAFYRYDGPCKHCVATILQYNQYYTNTIIPKLRSAGITRPDDDTAADERSSIDDAPMGQSGRGVSAIQPQDVSANEKSLADYYQRQRQREIEEEKARQAKIALQRATNVLSAYKQIVVNEVKANCVDEGTTHNVTLVPILEIDKIPQSVFLGFQIRRRSEQEMASDPASGEVGGAPASPSISVPVNRYPRAYVIKAIDEFIGATNRHNVMNFGKELSFKALDSAFDAVSLKWLQFLQRRYDECWRVTPAYLYGQRARRIKLTDEALDNLFEQFGDAWFRADESSPEYCQRISHEPPMLTATLEKDDAGAVTLSCPQIDSVYLGVDSGNMAVRSQEYYGSYHMTDEPSAALAPRYVYQVEENQLRRFSIEASAALAPLLLALMNARGVLTFSKEQTPDFFAHLLPEVSKYIQIEDSLDLMKQSAVDQMTGRILLDAPERERVTAVLLAGYNGTWLDLRSGQAVGQTPENAESSADMSWDAASLDISAIKRDFHAEQRFLAQTSAVLGFQRDDILSLLTAQEDKTLSEGSPQQPIVISGNDRIYHLLQHGVAKLQAMGDVLVTQRMRSLTVELPKKITIGVTLDSGLLKLNIDTDSIDLEELHAVMRAYHEKKSYYRLKNGSFLDLSRKNTDAYAGMDELCKVEQGLQLCQEDMEDGEVEVPAFRAMYLDGLFNDAVCLGIDKDEAFERLTARINDFAHAAFCVPKTLDNVLRPYQKTGYQWMRCLESCSLCGILADDMGLGKSVQFLSVLLAHDEAAGESAPDRLPSLIVCPSSLVLNWKKEAEKFAPSLAVRVIQGVQAARREQIRDIKARELVITSYDLLRRDEAEYKTIQFHYFAIDEAQYIKNHTTQAAKSVKKINCKQRFALTGTPIENRLSELWSIFDFLMPGYLYRYSQFKQQFETPITKDNDETAKSNLRRMILPFVLRRLKSEVLTELPPKTTTVVPVALYEKQLELYNATLLTGLQALTSQKDKPEGAAKMQALALLTKLRRLCCDPSLCFDAYKYGSAKLDVCIELLEQTKAGGHRALLFSQYTDMLDLIQARVETAGMSFLRLQGSTAVKDRLALVDAFNQGDADVFLISLKAGGTGLNLTAADTVIHYDPWWNLAAQDQATDRAYRIGQDKKVQVYKLIVQNTIEEKILKLQEMKKDLATIIDASNDEGGLMTMSTDEMIALLKDR